jgi:RND family efflux transporter MFP subunit
MDGTVTFLDIQRGEIASPNTVVATVIAPNALEIEAQIPEVDVSKLTVGNEVSITFDAIGGTVFKGTVSFIDPAETVIDGVVNYKIKISLQTEDARVKSGLTANVIINAQKKENVLALPEFALTEEDDGVYVQKLVNGEVQKTKVTMGMRGSNGVVEIIDGLSEGDLVESIGLK